MNYNTFAFFQNRVHDYRVILKPMKFKNHHKTNNKQEAEERVRSPGEKPASSQLREKPTSGPAVRGVGPAASGCVGARREASV